ncbi:MAG: TlpA family protein disulfide reductase [Actinomycetota bacterium]
MRIRRSLVSAAVVALVAAACGGAGPGADGTVSLLPADPFELPSFDFATYEELLGQLEGTPVVVNIWASWCGPCRSEAPHLAAAARAYESRVQFLGVDILDARESAREFMREFGWTYPSVFDETGAIRDRLGIIGQPATLFYGADGVLVDTWIGPIGEAELTKAVEELLA